jgi:hypothetical protein
MATVDNAGAQIHYEVTGDGTPVVLLHGFPDSRHLWRHQVPALTGAGYRVTVPDMLGYGRSATPRRAVYGRGPGHRRRRSQRRNDRAGDCHRRNRDEIDPRSEHFKWPWVRSLGRPVCSSVPSLFSPQERTVNEHQETQTTARVTRAKSLRPCRPPVPSNSRLATAYK